MTDELNRIKQKVERTNKHSAFTSFRLQMEEMPADKWISSAEQSAKMSLNIDGFHTLRYKMIRDRVVTIPLNEVSYRLENGNTYSFSSQYVAEKVAEKLGINASDITMNDAKIYFTMDALKSKVVPIVLQSNVTTARQYDIYGIPMIDPSSVTIYGPQEVIDTIKTVRTEPLTMNNVSQNFDAILPLDLLGGCIHSNVEEVKVEVQVEKFTEMDVEVPIKTDSLKMRFFPETMSVKCLVAMRDYASIKPESFTVAVDKQQLKAMQPLLDVRLAGWPPTVQIISTRPDKVEYLIVQ